MNSKQNIYSKTQAISAIFMILALLWLTVSTPFVFTSQQILSGQVSTDFDAPANSQEEDTANPFGSTTEEKTPGSISFSEEYLHDQHLTDHYFLSISHFHKCDNAGTYVAYHGELHVPPPNFTVI